jgi:hypothetical protein
MNSKSKKTKRLKILAVCLALPMVCFAYPLLHNWNLWRLRNSVASVRHPAGTSSVKFVQDIGNLSGTHNQIDYFVGEVRTYAGSKMRVKSFYSDLKVWNPIAKRFEHLNIVFTDDDSDEAQSLAWSQEINDWSLFPANNQKSYVVYVFDGGYEPGFDIRGY